MENIMAAQELTLLTMLLLPPTTDTQPYRRFTCSAPTNIAVIKYWGKRDTELILPINSSISGSLNRRDLCATTTVMASPKFSEDRYGLRM